MSATEQWLGLSPGEQGYEREALARLQSAARAMNEAVAWASMNARTGLGFKVVGECQFLLHDFRSEIARWDRIINKEGPQG